MINREEKGKEEKGGREERKENKNLKSPLPIY